MYRRVSGQLYGFRTEVARDKYLKKLQRVRRLGIHIPRKPKLDRPAWNYLFLDICELLEEGTNKIKVGDMYLSKRMIFDMYEYQEVYMSQVFSNMLFHNMIAEVRTYGRIAFYIVNPAFAFKNTKPKGIDVLFTKDFANSLQGAFRYVRKTSKNKKA